MFCANKIIIFLIFINYVINGVENTYALGFKISGILPFLKLEKYG